MLGSRWGEIFSGSLENSPNCSSAKYRMKYCKQWFKLFGISSLSFTDYHTFRESQKYHSQIIPYNTYLLHPIKNCLCQDLVFVFCIPPQDRKIVDLKVSTVRILKYVKCHRLLQRVEVRIFRFFNYFCLFGDHTMWCSELTPESVLRDHPSSKYPEDHMGCLRFNTSAR